MGQGPWLLGRLLHALFPPSLSPSPATPTIYRRIHQLRYLHDQQQQPTQQQQPAHHHAVAQGQAQPSSPESDPAPSPAQQHTPTALRPGHGRRAWHAVATPSACLWQHVRGKATWNGPLDPFMKLKQNGASAARSASHHSVSSPQHSSRPYNNPQSLADKWLIFEELTKDHIKWKHGRRKRRTGRGGRAARDEGSDSSSDESDGPRTSPFGAPRTRPDVYNTVHEDGQTRRGRGDGSKAGVAKDSQKNSQNSHGNHSKAASRQSAGPGRPQQAVSSAAARGHASPRRRLTRRQRRQHAAAVAAAAAAAAQRKRSYWSHYSIDSDDESDEESEMYDGTARFEFEWESRDAREYSARYGIPYHVWQQAQDELHAERRGRARAFRRRGAGQRHTSSHHEHTDSHTDSHSSWWRKEQEATEQRDRSHTDSTDRSHWSHTHTSHRPHSRDGFEEKLSGWWERYQQAAAAERQRSYAAAGGHTPHTGHSNGHNSNASFGANGWANTGGGGGWSHASWGGYGDSHSNTSGTGTGSGYSSGTYGGGFASGTYGSGSSSGVGGGFSAVRHSAEVVRHLARLGLGPNTVLRASEIKEAFVRCAKAYHPDKHLSGSSETGGLTQARAAAHFMEVKAAYEALKGLAKV